MEKFSTIIEKVKLKSNSCQITIKTDKSIVINDMFEICVDGKNYFFEVVEIETKSNSYFEVLDVIVQNVGYWVNTIYNDKTFDIRKINERSVIRLITDEDQKKQIKKSSTLC